MSVREVRTQSMNRLIKNGSFQTQPDAESGAAATNVGQSFTGPLARSLAPWLAIVIVLLGPVVVLRNAIERPGRLRR